MSRFCIHVSSMIMNLGCALHGTKTLNPALVLLCSFCPQSRSNLFHFGSFGYFYWYDFAAVISLESQLKTGLMR